MKRKVKKSLSDKNDELFPTKARTNFINEGDFIKIGIGSTSDFEIGFKAEFFFEVRNEERPVHGLIEVRPVPKSMGFPEN